MPEGKETTADRESDGNSGVDLSLMRPYRGDPVLRFLLERCRFGVRGVAVSAFFAFFVVNVFINALQGTLWPTEELPSALFSRRWITQWTLVPIAAPVLFAAIVVLYRRIPILFEDLRGSNVIVAKKDPTAFFGALQRRYEGRAIDVLLILVIAAFYGGAVIVKSRQDSSDWWHVVPGTLTWATWYFYAIWLLGAYVLLRLAYVLFVTFRTFRQMFQENDLFRVELRLMHPDRCCGLRPLSHFLLRVNATLGFLGLVCAIFIVASLYRYGGIAGTLQQIGQPLLLLIYLGAVPIVFFLPLIPAHDLMRDTKHQFLHQLSRVFDRRFREVSTRLSAGEIESSEMEGLKAIEDLYRYAERMPVWPFDFASLRRLFITLVVPILVPAVAVLVERIISS